MTGLTPVQAKTLAFIRAFIAEHGWSPSVAEIARGLDLRSTSGVHRVLCELEERGFITHLARRRRSIRITAQATEGDGVDFLPHQLAVWVRVIAARAGVKPLDVVIECVREGYVNTTGRNSEQTASREAIGARSAA